MPVKVSKATKELAYRKLRDGLGNKEVAELTGLSLRSVGRMKALLDGKVAMPSRNARTSQSQTPIGQDKTQTGNSEITDTAVPLQFEDSPDPVEKKSLVDQGMDTLKGLLGFSPKDEKKAPPVLSAKLDAKRQQFVDSVTPTVSLAFTLAAAWMWGSIGPEYGQLAPDEKTANRIIEPLVRIYARHASFLTDVNPDVADAGSSLVALIGYVYTSLGLYQQIKQEKEANEQSSNDRYRPAPTAESSTSHQGSGLYAVPRTDREHGPVNGVDGGYTPSVNRPDLSAKEQAQLAALSQLAAKDYEHRARRAGRL